MASLRSQVPNVLFNFCTVNVNSMWWSHVPMTDFGSKLLRWATVFQLTCLSYKEDFEVGWAKTVSTEFDRHVGRTSSVGPS